MEPPAVVVIRRRLQSARAAGRTFDLAWRGALFEVKDKEWREILRATEIGWRAAYENAEPTAAERGLAHVASNGVGRLFSLDVSRRCGLCDEVLPDGGHSSRRYCCEQHRQAAYRQAH
jgi:hypothetical protein